MARVKDLWTAPGAPDARGRATRVRTPRYGHGKRWLAVWQDHGRDRSKAFTVKDAAEAHLARVDVEQRAGTYVPPSSTTVAEYGDRWITEQLHHRRSTSEQLESRWRLHIRPALGHLRLADVTRAHVQAAVVDWNRTLAPTTVRVCYSYLTSLLKASVDDRLLRVTPAKGIRLPEVTRERVTPLTVGQVHAIAERVTPRYRAMVLLAAATGLRSGELRGLTVDRLEFSGDGLRIRVDRQLTSTTPTWGPPKTVTSDRALTVDEHAARAVREHIGKYPPHPTGLLFTGRLGGPMSRTTAQAVWKRATVGMGLRARSGWHDLRHFYASLLIRAGLSVTAVADLLGHKDKSETLDTYAHLWADDHDRAREAVGASLWGGTQTERLRLVGP